MITVAFLNVGQGDSTVIQLPDKKSAFVIDCPRKAVTLSYLREHNLGQLAAVYISHSDSDHAGGIVDLVRNYGTVQTDLYFNHDTFRDSKKLLLRKLRKAVDNQGISPSPLHQGAVHQHQTVQVNVLHPTYGELFSAAISDKPNDASALLRVTYGKWRVLLTADISAKGWRNVFQRNEQLDANILKFPHHGAWEETVPEMLTQVAPELVVLSVGTRNPYKHPNLETLQYLYNHNSNSRFVCTEATPQCHALLNASRGGQVCGGTIVVEIGGANGISITPSPSAHQAIIAAFDQPQCLP